MIKYLDRKNKELKQLSTYLKQSENISSSNVFDMLSQKEKLVIKLRSYNNKKFYHRLTNTNQLFFSTSDFMYNYTYERFNGFIHIDNFANSFYNLKNSFKTETYFTNCGMSAITSLLSSVVLSNDVMVDLLYEETYFETIKYMSMIMKNTETKKALYIDSIASDFDFDIQNIKIENYSFVIIDTTCFLGFEFKNMLNYILNKSIPCILVRSHTKLDLLGTEYSHIGSASFIYPNNIAESFLEQMKKIEFDCRHLIGVYGACLPPERFPVFMLDNQLLKLNKKRIKLVKDNAKTFYDDLKKEGFNIELPTHQQFCMLYFDNSKYTLDELKRKIIQFCKEQGNIFPVYHAVSFGLDYFAIDCYQDFISKKYKIRVCLNDMPKQNIKLFEIEFNKFFRCISQ